MKRKRHGFLLFNIVTLLSTVLAMTRMPDITNLGAVPVDIEPIAKPEIDLITIKTLIRQVNAMQNNEPLEYLNRIDSVVKEIKPDAVRNPFAIALKPVVIQPKPKPKTTVKHTPKPKPRPRIRRPQITINGIVWDVQEPYAILNGELYRVGDDISGYTIYAILDTIVVLKNDRDKYVVNYHEE